MLATPLGEFEAEFPVDITKCEVTKATYYPNQFSYEGNTYSFRYNCTTYARLTDADNVDDWGYVYVDPEGKTSQLISLKAYGNSVGDPRYVYHRNDISSTVKLRGYVKYVDNDEIYYGEIKEFEIKYPEESSLSMTNCTFQGTETNVTYQGKTYKYKSTYRYLFTATGAYWLKVGTEERGSGWSGWSLPDYTTMPVDGSNALTVNYYYDDKTFAGEYDVYLKGTDNTHSNVYLTPEYATYTYSGNQFSGCVFHQASARSQMQAPEQSEDVYNMVINKTQNY